MTKLFAEIAGPPFYNDATENSRNEITASAAAAAAAMWKSPSPISAIERGMSTALAPYSNA